jgi:hypothetical protein
MVLVVLAICRSIERDNKRGEPWVPADFLFLRPARHPLR